MGIGIEEALFGGLALATILGSGGAAAPAVAAAAPAIAGTVAPAAVGAETASLLACCGAGSGALGAGASLAPAAQALGTGALLPAGAQSFGGISAGLEAGLGAGGAGTNSLGMTFGKFQDYMKLAQAGSQVGSALSPGAPPQPSARRIVQHQAPNINFAQLMQPSQGAVPIY